MQRTLSQVRRRPPILTALWLAVALAVAAACAGSADRPALSPTTRATTAASAPPTATSLAVATTVPAPSGALADAACRGQLRAETTGALATELDEVSGMAASRRHKGILWVIEDSGNPATVSAVGYDGARRATIRLAGVANLDWEDLAIGPGPDGRDSIYVADIGDNFRLRPNVTIYRFAEPDAIADASIPAASIERIEGRYTTGPTDSEALFVDSAGTLWTIGKVAPGERAPLYRLDRQRGELAPVGEPLDVGGGQVTGADLSPDGRVLAVRTYGSVLVIAMGDPPDRPRGRACAVSPPVEPNGESIAILTDRTGIATVGEAPRGEHAEVHVLK